MPLISVIVPVYKVEPYLRECVDSILNQTFTDFELILVDDGSPDNCPVICDEYAKIDDRIFVIHKENGGLSSARNAGLDYVFAHSDSKYVSFIDSDDYVSSNYLQALLDSIIETDSDIAICNALLFDRKSNVKKALPIVSAKVIDTKQLFTLAAKVGYIYTVSWGKLYKKEVFNRIRFKVRRIHEDEFFVNRLYSKNCTATVIADKLYFYFQNPCGIMSKNTIDFDYIDWRIERIKLLSKNEDEIKNNYYFEALNHLSLLNFDKKTKTPYIRTKLLKRYIQLFFVNRKNTKLILKLIIIAVFR